MIGDKWIKISDDAIKFLQNTKKGGLDELPEELQKLFLASPEQLGDIWLAQQAGMSLVDIEVDIDKNKLYPKKLPDFEEIYNFDGNIDNIKKGTILINEEEKIYTVNDIIIGSGITFLDVEESRESIMIGTAYDERFGYLKIKEKD